MWVLTVLFWRRPKLARILIVGWLLLTGIELSVIAPGQLYLRAAAPQSPYRYDIPVPLLMIGAVAGPAFVVAAVMARRRVSARGGTRTPTPGGTGT